MNMHCVAKLLLTQHSRYEVMLNVLRVQTRLHSHTLMSRTTYGAVSLLDKQLLTVVASIKLAFAYMVFMQRCPKLCIWLQDLTDCHVVAHLIIEIV